MRVTTLCALLGLALMVPGLTGCSMFDELDRLREENAQLRAQLEELLARPTDFEGTRIDELTVGLAASEKDFDERSFIELLKSSLQMSVSEDETINVNSEDDEQQIAKVRGMLIQQYISANKVPIRISNLSFKVKSSKSIFKIGGAVVPTDELKPELTTDGLTRFVHEGEIQAEMDRDAAGEYSIAYEDTDGGSGVIPISLQDVEVASSDQPPQTARQGDTAFNWQLSLEKVHVFRVSGFRGDVGKFILSMRYPSNSGLNQFQTMQDSVFLFGYGPYATGLLQRLQTPSYITDVEVMQIESEVSEQLTGGISSDELDDVLSSNSGIWIDCKFADITGSNKIWERPVTVGFPFISKQISQEKNLVFFVKYDEIGQDTIIGNYKLRGK